MKDLGFERYLGKRRFLVGVSGGLDSMALLHILEKQGFRNGIVCHLNHGLRGRESGGDERFVVKAAERVGYEVELRKVDVMKLSKKEGCSVETAGRMARHDFFGMCARKFRCNTLLLAHHADDQAETVLWNLLRGSFGFRGMREVTEMEMDGKAVTIFRPLLHVRKHELASWMKENGFAWREDSTNAVNDVVRNRLRNEAIPLLDEISGRDVVTNLVRAAQIDDEWRGVLDWAVGKAHAYDPQGRLHAGVMRELPEMLRRSVISNFLMKHGIGGVDNALLERCVELLEVGAAASVNLPGGGRLRRRAGRIFVEIV